MRTVCTFFVLLAMMFVVPMLGAQDEDYTLRHQDADGNADVEDAEDGDDVVMYVMCDFEDGGDMQGYQWGVCHDGDALTLEDGDVVQGSYTDDDDAGGAAISFTFEAVTVIDETDAHGWTVGALLNVITGDVIEPTEDAEMYCATYTVDDAATGSDLEFCETLGSPAVTVRVIVDSAEIEPVQETSNISGGDDDDGFTFGFGDEDGTLDAWTSDSADFTVLVYIGGDDETETQGFQMSIGYDTDFMTATEPDDDEDLLADALADLDDGAGPAFFGPNFSPDGGGGLTVGVVYDLFGDIVLVFGDPATPVFSLDFESDAEDMDTTDLTFEKALGDPPLVNQVVVDGDGVLTTNTDLAITFEIDDDDVPAQAAGDVDGDGEYAINDVFDIIEFLYDGGSIDCEAAAAALDDPTDELTNADILYLLNYIYLDGPEPGAGVGECEVFDGCPIQDAC